MDIRNEANYKTKHPSYLAQTEGVRPFRDVYTSIIRELILCLVLRKRSNCEQFFGCPRFITEYANVFANTTAVMEMST